MREFDRNPANMAALNALRPAEKKRGGALGFQEYQELKSSVHRELLAKVDLEKVATMRDARTRSQVFIIIQDLVENLNTPMSPELKHEFAKPSDSPDPDSYKAM